MTNLLNAGFCRLRKNKPFWILVIMGFMMSAFEIAISCIMMNEYDTKVLLSELLFDPTSFLGIVSAIFISFFIGVEYSDGTIRNKIIIGHSRKSIYFSNFIISVVAVNLILMAYFLPTLIIGTPIFGKISIPIGLFMTKLAVVEMAVIAYCAIFISIAMLIANRTSMSVVTLVLAFLLVFVAAYCQKRIDAPEYFEITEIIEDGSGRVEYSTELNTRYLKGAKRKLYEFLYNVNPAGCDLQQQYASDKKDIAYLPIYMLAVTVVFTAGGAFIFERRELK